MIGPVAQDINPYFCRLISSGRRTLCMKSLVEVRFKERNVKVRKGEVGLKIGMTVDSATGGLSKRPRGRRRVRDRIWRCQTSGFVIVKCGVNVGLPHRRSVFDWVRLVGEQA
jgi:hypothetical protein